MTLENFRRIDIKLDKADDYIVDTLLDAHTGDYDGRTLTLQITNGGQVINTKGLVVNFGFEHTTTGKKGVYPAQALDESQGIYQVSYPKDMLVVGNAVCQFRIQDGKHITNTKNFSVRIVQDIITKDVIVAENSVIVIEKALIDIADHENRVSRIEQNFHTILAMLNSNVPNLDAAVSTRATQTSVDKMQKDVTIIKEKVLSNHGMLEQLVDRRVVSSVVKELTSEVAYNGASSNYKNYLTGMQRTVNIQGKGMLFYVSIKAQYQEKSSTIDGAYKIIADGVIWAQLPFYEYDVSEEQLVGVVKAGELPSIDMPTYNVRYSGLREVERIELKTMSSSIVNEANFGYGSDRHQIYKLTFSQPIPFKKSFEIWACSSNGGSSSYKKPAICRVVYTLAGGAK